jgi:hypothetical protein
VITEYVALGTPLVAADATVTTYVPISEPDVGDVEATPEPWNACTVIDVTPAFGTTFAANAVPFEHASVEPALNDVAWNVEPMRPPVAIKHTFAADFVVNVRPPVERTVAVADDPLVTEAAEDVTYPPLVLTLSSAPAAEA